MNKMRGDLVCHAPMLDTHHKFEFNACLVNSSEEEQAESWKYNSNR